MRTVVILISALIWFNWNKDIILDVQTIIRRAFMKETCAGFKSWLKAGNTEMKSNSEFLLSSCKTNETTILILFTPVIIYYLFKPQQFILSFWIFKTNNSLFCCQTFLMQKTLYGYVLAWDIHKLDATTFQKVSIFSLNSPVLVLGKRFESTSADH